MGEKSGQPNFPPAWKTWAIVEKGPRAIHLLLDEQQSFGNMPLLQSEG